MEATQLFDTALKFRSGLLAKATDGTYSEKDYVVIPLAQPVKVPDYGT